VAVAHRRGFRTQAVALWHGFDLPETWTTAMTDTITPLAADFPTPDEAQWRALVDKILNGAEFDKRLVSKTLDGLAIKPLYTRADGRTAISVPAPNRAGLGWDIRQRHIEADPVAANVAILDDLAGGVTSMARALQGVLLDVCPIALDAGDNALDAAASLLAVWRERGIADDQRRGAFNLDPLGALARTGALILSALKSLELAARLAADTLAMPHVAVLAADGRPYHEAGASEAQELAAVLGTLVAHLRACEAAGVAPGKALTKIAVLLTADADVFVTTAKLRAARVLIQRVAEACGAGAAAAHVSITASTSQRMLTRRDPWVNILRAATACTASAFGNADAVEVLAFSWPLGQPDAFARRVARNTHIVLQEESGLGRVADPAAGAWFMEQLTADLAARAWTTFQDWEAQGGMLAVLQSGFVQKQIAETVRARAQALATGKIELTGTSAFPRLGDDGVTVQLWPVVAPVSAGAASVRSLPAHRLAEPFEALRDAADAAAKAGTPMRLFLATIGPLSVYAARATWIRNFLAAGGIEAITGPECHTSTEVGAAFAASGATVACLCSSDAVYSELGEAIASLLKTAGAGEVALAGWPKGQAKALEAAGVDRFISVGCDAIAALTGLQAAIQGASKRSNGAV
jgi:methylmalonyl-CoA mutase